jgi:hypothetical protein
VPFHTESERKGTGQGKRAIERRESSHLRIESTKKREEKIWRGRSDREDGT